MGKILVGKKLIKHSHRRIIDRTRLHWPYIRTGSHIHRPDRIQTVHDSGDNTLTSLVPGSFVDVASHSCHHFRLSAVK